METTIARIDSNGVFTTLELQELSLIEQITEGFSGIISGNTFVFNNGIKLIFGNSLPTAFSCKLVSTTKFYVELQVDNTRIVVNDVSIGSDTINSYDISSIQCNYFINSIVIQTINNSIDFSYSVVNESWYEFYNPDIPIGITITIQEMINNVGVSIGSSNTKCLKLIESSEQIPDYYAWINHIKIGDLEQLTNRDQILFSKDFLDSNGYTDGTVISLQDNQDNGISFIRQGDVFNNIEVNISNLGTSDFYIDHVLFPHKESHVDQFHLYGGYTSSRVFIPEVTLSPRLYAYIKTENGNDIYEISDTSIPVLKAAWVLRPIYLSIVSGANILCSQLVESYKQTYEVYEPKIIDYKISAVDGNDETNYIKIGINNLNITLSFTSERGHWDKWQFSFSTKNPSLLSGVVFYVDILEEGYPKIREKDFSDWESTSDIQINGIIGTSSTNFPISVTVEKNGTTYSNIDIENRRDIYDISSNPIIIEQEDRWYRSLPSID